MLSSHLLRYASIIVGTVMWDAGAVLQKRAVDGLRGPAPAAFAARAVGLVAFCLAGFSLLSRAEASSETANA